MDEIINHDFNKIVTDLIKDLALVFPDIIEKTYNDDIVNVLQYIQYQISIENEDETYYLEWDIKDNKTDGKIFRNIFSQRFSNRFNKRISIIFSKRFSKIFNNRFSSIFRNRPII